MENTEYVIKESLNYIRTVSLKMGGLTVQEAQCYLQALTNLETGFRVLFPARPMEVKPGPQATP